ncbi:MAG: flagellar motor protein MotB [Planctomycetaceae bacterium]
MPRKQSPPSSSGDIPAWFMTYSDVITLMMTFFILLLTFATSEPERFEQMQTSMFGFADRTGIAGKNPDSIDRDAIVLRYRPTSGRLTSRGSEMPPLESDPVRESLGRGLEALDEDNEKVFEQQFQFDIAASLFIDDKGLLTTIAQQHLRMLATQMSRLPLFVRLEVTDGGDAAAMIEAARVLTTAANVPAGRVGVGVSNGPAGQQRQIRLIVSQRQTRDPAGSQTADDAKPL